MIRSEHGTRQVGVIARSIIRYTLENAGMLLVGVGGVAIAICALVGLHDPVSTLMSSGVGRAGLAFAAVTLVGYVIQVVQQKSRARLEHELRSARDARKESEALLAQRRIAAAECFRGHLALIAQRLSFGGTERISVYKVTQDGRFRIVGRYSANADFDAVHRTVHEHGEGIISKVFTSMVPEYWDPNQDPDSDFKVYAREHYESYGIPQEVVAKFTMRSRSYAAFAILDYDKTRCSAVIVFESTVKHRMTEVTAHYKIAREVEDTQQSLQRFVSSADATSDYLTVKQVEQAAPSS